jgi:hypothetical protein
MNNIQIWPFLITRNQHLDYHTIIMPDFIAASKSKGIIQRNTQSERIQQSFKIVLLPNSNVGNITIAYRVVQAEINGIPFLDPYQRPIYRIEGFVAKGLHDNLPDVDAAMQSVKTLLDNTFDNFLSRTSAQAALTSKPINGGDDKDSKHDNKSPEQTSTKESLNSSDIIYFVWKKFLELITNHPKLSSAGLLALTAFWLLTPNVFQSNTDEENPCMDEKTILNRETDKLTTPINTSKPDKSKQIIANESKKQNVSSAKSNIPNTEQPHKL